MCYTIVHHKGDDRSSTRKKTVFTLNRSSLYTSLSSSSLVRLTISTKNFSTLMPSVSLSPNTTYPRHCKVTVYGHGYLRISQLPLSVRGLSTYVVLTQHTHLSEYVPRMAFLVDYTMSRSCMGDSSLDCSSMQFACRLHSAFPFGSAQVLIVVLPTANMDHNRKMHHRLGFGYCLCAGGEVAKR